MIFLGLWWRPGVSLRHLQPVPDLSSGGSPPRTWRTWRRRPASSSLCLSVCLCPSQPTMLEEEEFCIRGAWFDWELLTDSYCGSSCRSAPGTPLRSPRAKSSRSCSRSPSRTNSEESGHLRVPLVRARGISLPDGMEESLTQHKSYLRRQYNIKVSIWLKLDIGLNTLQTSNLRQYFRARKLSMLATPISPEPAVTTASTRPGHSGNKIQSCITQG